MFNENDNVVYPGHGVARVDRIITKNVAGKNISFFELRFINKEMTILVPVSQAESVGLRSLSSLEYIEEIFSLLSMVDKEKDQKKIQTVNWNRRNKLYQQKLKSGNLYDISMIYKDLKLLEQKKDLSFGEKQLLQVAEELLVEEMALVVQVKKDTMVNQLRLMTGSNQLHQRSF